MFRHILLPERDDLKGGLAVYVLCLWGRHIRYPSTSRPSGYQYPLSLLRALSRSPRRKGMDAQTSYVVIYTIVSLFTLPLRCSAHSSSTDHQGSARITPSISVCYVTLPTQVSTTARTESPKCLLTLPLKGWKPESLMLAGNLI